MATVFLYAKARALAGKAEYQSSQESIEGIVGELACDSQEMAQLLQTCSFLVDGIQSSELGAHIHPQARIDVLPRFAGG